MDASSAAEQIYFGLTLPKYGSNLKLQDRKDLVAYF